MKKSTYNMFCKLPFIGPLFMKIFEPVVSSLGGMLKIMNYEIENKNEKYTIATQFKQYSSRK